MVGRLSGSGKDMVNCIGNTVLAGTTGVTGGDGMNYRKIVYECDITNLAEAKEQQRSCEYFQEREWDEWFLPCRYYEDGDCLYETEALEC
jgi:hypothetical protein